MDQLSQQLSSVSLYDVKKYVRKAQNAVLNFSDMEAKVREATNNEPWGTPTSTMQLIAEGTKNYQQFHEIMPFIYRRFSEKSASEWRQIYKSVQLLDYLIRNGSERVVDYARSHVSIVEMLRHFSYIDSRGVDQGASVRKRSEEIVALLSNTEKLRAERKKAKQLNAKTSGAGYGSGGFGGSGRKYGGISSETYRAQNRYGGAPTQQVYGDGGGFDGSNHFSTSTSAGGSLDNDEFEEYEVKSSVSRSPSRSAAHARQYSASKAARKNEALNSDDDDDFADFQAAPIQPSAPKSLNANILDLFDSPAPAPVQTSIPASSSLASFSSSPSQPSNGPASTQLGTLKSPASIDLFDSLWESSKSTPLKPATKPAMQVSSLKPSTLQSPTTQAPTNQASSSKAPAKASDDIVNLLDF